MAPVVLGAGASTRMGGSTKLTLPYRGEPLVRWPVHAALAAGFAEVGLVVGHEADAVAKAVADLPVVRIDNPRFAEGLSTSVVAALSWAAGRAAAVLFLLGDEPGIAPEALRRVLDAWRARPDVACRARYRDRVGHPVILRTDDAGRAEGDRGLRDRLETGRPEVRLVEIDGPAPADIDTPADYRRALARLPH